MENIKNNTFIHNLHQSGETYRTDVAVLLLRTGLAIIMLFHGAAKLSGGVDGISTMLFSAGMPASLSLGVYLGEVIAPILVLLGIWTRAAATVIAINMIFAVILVHSTQLFTLSKNGGWALELQGMLLLCAIVIAIVGAGRFGLDDAIRYSKR